MFPALDRLGLLDAFGDIESDLAACRVLGPRLQRLKGPGRVVIVLAVALVADGLLIF